MSRQKIAVLGGGNGAIATAADLSQRGFAVNLFELPEFASGIGPLEARGGISVKGDAEREGFVPLNLVTTDIVKALEGVDLIILAVPGFAIEHFAKHVAPHLTDGQSVLLNGGATGGAIRFKRVVDKGSTCKASIKVGETASLTYGCRRTGPTEVTIHVRVKKGLFLSAFPAKDTSAVLATVSQVYSCVVPAQNVLETALNNGNPLYHPVITVLNASLVETKGEKFYLYRDGLTPTVARVVEALDKERLAVCRAFGFAQIPAVRRAANYGYAQYREGLYEEFSSSPIYMGVHGPKGFADRFLTEDIPFGLVFWTSIAAAAAVPTPIMDAITDLGSALAGRDFRQEGLTLGRLGLNGLSVPAILDYMHNA